MIACRTCGAEIVWGRTLAGRNMPLNADPVPDGNIVLARAAGGIVVRFVSRNMDAETRSLVETGAPRYVSHFATCPQANAHRRHP